MGEPRSRIRCANCHTRFEEPPPALCPRCHTTEFEPYATPNFGLARWCLVASIVGLYVLLSGSAGWFLDPVAMAVSVLLDGYLPVGLVLVQVSLVLVIGMFACVFFPRPWTFYLAFVCVSFWILWAYVMSQSTNA